MPRHPLATLTAPCPLPAHRPGAQVGLLAPEQMQPLLPRLVPGLLAALRKEKEWERLPVTQARTHPAAPHCTPPRHAASRHAPPRHAAPRRTMPRPAAPRRLAAVLGTCVLAAPPQALWAALAHAEACELGGVFVHEELLQPSFSELHSLLCAPLDRACSATLRTHNEQARACTMRTQHAPHP